jgi:hypothetical protein
LACSESSNPPATCRVPSDSLIPKALAALGYEHAQGKCSLSGNWTQPPTSIRVVPHPSISWFGPIRGFADCWPKSVVFLGSGNG